MEHSFDTKSAHPGLQSAAYDSLTSLPAPREQIVAAVYQFRDQTGQYKQKERGSTFSRAVTQGGTAILMKALSDSEWFNPIERRGLSNLTQERDIIRSIRSQYEQGGGQQLSPLLFAGVVLEGGIIGYDTNVITGGGGLRFASIGGSGEYRQDQVTVYLRAVSTQTGEVLQTVHTTKTILSQKLEGGAFRFIAPNRLLEAEAGMSYNEPTTVAVTEAIDASVHSLVLEGIRDGTFTSRDSTAGQKAVNTYETRSAQTARRDYFDRLLRPNNRSGMGLEVEGGGRLYQGDFRNSETMPSISAALQAPLSSRWVMGLEGTYGRLQSSGFGASTVSTHLQLTYHFVPKSRFTPFLRAEAGVLTQTADPYRFGQTAFPVGGGGIGMEYMVNNRVGVSAIFGARYTTSDNLDGVRVGRYYDSIWNGSVALTYYGLGTIF